MFIKYMITYFSNREVVCELSKVTAGIYHFITCTKCQLVIFTDKGKYNNIIST